MNFNSRIAKIGKGKFVNGVLEGREICLYLNNGGMRKKILTDDENGFNIRPAELVSGCTEIIKLSGDIFIKRTQSNIKVENSEN